MACFYPLKGWKSKHLTAKGKRQIVFNRNEGFSDLPITVPCGQCIGCRLEKSRQWAIRCSHEASLYNKNIFITLTYNDTYLPTNGSLNLTHFQEFMKRLRFHNPKKSIRYYHCGEYGEKTGRPHYHACIFNHDFEDKVLYKETKGGRLYNSAQLSKLWPWGHAVIGSVTFQSAAYVARYIMKKINGELADQHYEWVDEHGEIHVLKPEYTTMSLKPGIGSGWLRKYATDVYPDDFVIMQGKKMRPPKFYDHQFELIDPKEITRIKRRRVVQSKNHADNNTPERLRVREQVQKARLNKLPRNLGEDN